MLRSVCRGGGCRKLQRCVRKLSISSVMVGKYVRQLEATLGTRWVHRITRRQYLTETGVEFYKNARAVLEQIKLAECSIENMQAGPRGLLRISAPTTLDGCAIAPLLAVYLVRYTAVNVELVLSNAVVDLVSEGFDIAVRIGDLVDAELVAKLLRIN
jgi:DNA-binding transcriptional LysR family regulator